MKCVSVRACVRACVSACVSVFVRAGYVLLEKKVV